MSTIKTLLLAPVLALLFISTLASAQSSGIEDAYDPFADYSDFVEASTEETDVNFFKFGRMLSVGLSVGSKFFTGNQGDFYSSSVSFGGHFTYYLSIQLAVQLGFTSSTHNAFFDIPGSDNDFSGKSRFNAFSLHGKYFINTQNLTKSIARYNPFIVGGISSLTRETRSSEQFLFSSKETATSFDVGAGLEYIFNSNKNYVSFKVLYHVVDFSDENTDVQINIGNGQENSGFRPSGDPIDVVLSVGFNF